MDETIKRYNNNAEHERTHGNLQGCLEFKQLAEWLKELKNLKEKDESKEVRYEYEGYSYGKLDMAFCPSCEHIIEADSENWGCEFCPNCGQRLRWEE
jgi:rubrerythrin